MGLAITQRQLEITNFKLGVKQLFSKRSQVSTLTQMMWALGHTRVDARTGHFCVILALTIRTLWSWAINNLEEYSKLNMLQDHIYKSKKKKKTYCSRSIIMANMLLE